MIETPVLSLRNLSFRYRDRPGPSLRGINLELRAGELLLVAGASGCGKTTLIRCINGLAPRSYKGELGGEVLIKGSPTGSLSLARISQLVGTVLQDPERQILSSRVLNEVAFGLENLALPRPEILERSQAALNTLGIAALSDRETFSLSGGEKQKVALAGALAMRPSLLLLDEPLASLDPASAQDTLALVRRLVDEGMAVMVVEHRVEDVLHFKPGRVMYITDGEMRYLGPVEGLTKVVNYAEIKMPVPMILARAAATPVPAELKILPSVSASDAAQAVEPLVRFREVSFEYEPGRPVLSGVNLDIRRGDVIAVLGPNGAGKTTLVKHAIGLLKPTAGQVLVNGKDTRQMTIAQIASVLGYVFQSPSHMLFASTVREELAFGPINLGHPPAEIEQDVAAAIRIVNLVGREADAPLSLSFGQQKRVSIASVLSMRSRILVMDEPTAGQDYKNYMEFMDAILQLPNFESILFITHDIDLAVIYANRVLLVDGGKLAADGPPKEVLKDFDRLVASRLVPTSLLKTNLEYLPRTHRFLRAEALAHLI